VLGIVVILAGRAVVTLGGEACDAPDFDLAFVIVGSGGHAGIVTEICVGCCRSRRGEDDAVRLATIEEGCRRGGRP